MTKAITVGDLIDLANCDAGKYGIGESTSYQVGYIGGTLASLLNGETTVEAVMERVRRSAETTAKS